MAVTKSSPRSENRYSTDDQRWRAVVDRNLGADGLFFYSVKTTGVFCRPSCTSRRARRENVRFHRTVKEAEQAGFRACKRCHPTSFSLGERYGALISRACRLIEDAPEPPDLESLAKEIGMSPSHFHRIFKSLTGLTPKSYTSAHRSQRVREKLSQNSSVTAAVYSAGFNSNGRFYATSTKVLGMTPTSFRTGGMGTAIRFAVGECSLGSILVAASNIGICSILLGDDPDELVRDLQDRFPKAELIGNDAQFEQSIAQVIGFVEHPAMGLGLPLHVQGTAFQQRVWKALCEIPCGQTVNYTEIAQRLGQPKAARAVAQACAANPIAVAIPCHRVVRTDETLSGYRWGVERKAKLLERERAET